jgi:hypothetical protein
MMLEQQLGFGRSFGIHIYFSPYDDFLMSGFSGAGNPEELRPLRIGGGPRGIKLFEGQDTTPLVRVDYPKHGKNPPFHLQYGGKEKDGCNPERSGDEAVDILAQLLTLTKRPLYSSEGNEEDENKD